jgi:glyoxylase-like metal-dependent hydrolase (beta-lactamase superfamily II)
MLTNTSLITPPNFFLLGTTHFPTHLLASPLPTLFEAGVACLGPLYVKEIRKVLGERPPKFLLLTHMHFDHCGAAAYLKAAFPGITIGASQKAAEIIARPHAVETMARLNDDVKRWVDAETPHMARQVPFQPFDVDLVLSDGDRIDVGGGLVVEVMETPGHTRDSLSFYIPQYKLALVGESCGIIDPSGFASAEFLSDFEDYLANLERFSAMDVEIVSQSHFQLFSGDDARTFFNRAIGVALAFRERVEQLLDQENGDVSKVIALIKAEEYDSRPGPKQPLAAYMLNLEARVRHLSEHHPAEHHPTGH